MLPANILESRRGRLAAFSLLYLSEGIPFGFTAVALVTYLRQQGVGLTEIGLFTASLYAPWGLKWAWAPIVDLVRIERFGARRAWIVGAQAMMAVTLGVVVAVDPAADLRLLTLLMIVHNLFSATQDIAIDALAVQVLPEHERGTANGFMFGSSYLGQAIGGSGAIWLAGKLGFQATFPFVCGLILLILVLVSMRIREPRIAAGAAELALGTAAAARGAAAVVAAVARRLAKYMLDLVRGFFLAGSGPVLGVVYGLLPPGALALGLALGSTMQVDLGMDEDRIARLNLFTTVASALGCVAGGWVSDRLGHRKSLAAWTVLTTLPTFWLAGKFTGVEGMAGVTLATYTVGSLLYAFTAGLIYGTSVAVFMGLTSPIVAATQFSGYMALHNFVYSYSSAWQGSYAEAFGYARTLRLDAWLALVPILTFPFLRPANREILRGRAAAVRLGKFAALFVFAAPVCASFAGDWRAPGRDVLALWASALLALGLGARGARPSLFLGTSGIVAAIAAALLAGRWVDGHGFDRAVGFLLAATASSGVAVGLLAAARYEAAKERRPRAEPRALEGATS
jgi:PAT family beta-lactamase induction signal transducer AmpG